MVSMKNRIDKALKQDHDYYWIGFADGEASERSGNLVNLLLLGWVALAVGIIIGLVC